MTLDFGLDFWGRYFSGTSWFWNLGASLVIKSGHHWIYDNASIIQGSFKVGYLVGSLKSWFMTFQGGVEFNYLASMTMNNKTVDLSGTDRTSWNGVVGISIGYHGFGIGADYLFPFGSGDGAWLVGLRCWN